MKRAAAILLISGFVVCAIGVGEGYAQETLFHERVDLPTGIGQTATANGDLDGDGFPDLVLGDYVMGSEPEDRGTRIRVLLGKGNGSFKTPVTVWSYFGVLVPYQVSGIDIADLDSDDNPDIVFAASVFGYGPSIGGIVVVIMGNGDGTFEEGVLLSPPGEMYAIPTGIVSSDLNHDNAPDLCVSLGAVGLGSLLVLLNNGDGTFTDQYIGYADDYTFVAASDLNGDTHIDLAATTFYTDEVVVFLGLGDGTFGAPVGFAAGDYPASVAAEDLNDDDVPDLAVANQYSDDVSVLLGLGDGTFQAAVNYSVGEEPVSIVVADFDGDTSPEIAVANQGTEDVSVLMGNGDGTFGDEGRYATLNYPQTLSVGDFNVDTHADLSLAANGGASVFMNVQGAPPATAWGAASTMYPRFEAPSKALNTCLLLLISVGTVLVWRGRRRRE